eukprot:14162191-Alexandrium_andersonii.AAC.1
MEFVGPLQVPSRMFLAAEARGPGARKPTGCVKTQFQRVQNSPCSRSRLMSWSRARKPMRPWRCRA